MTRAISAVAFTLTVAAVVLMLLPTYGTVWGLGLIRPYPWYDILLVAYLHFVPGLSLISGIVMTAGLVLALLSGRTVGWVAVPGFVAAALLAAFSYDQNNAGFVLGAGEWVAPILAAAAVSVTISWVLERRGSPRARS